jgi:hypothetical protein
MATSLQTPPVEHLSVLDRWAARERNESSYLSTCSYHGLPESTHVAVQATETAVLVTATDIDVLAEWLFVMGGLVSTVDLPSGQTVWTLRTVTWSDSPKFPPVPVFVSVVLPTEASVICEIVEATRTPRLAAEAVAA